MIGTLIQNYEIKELIDEGGMGSIYLGIHKFLPRKVAIKVLNPLLRNRKEIIERFKNEALILSKLQHPNIITLYDYVENNEANYIIMEYVDGESLAEYIETTTGPIPETRTISLFLKILDAVNYAHEKNIIHRDIKPANFIIDKDYNIKILDFGIAKSIDALSKSLTQTGTKVGTTLFMSPQQVRGQVLDRRTDIYSLGVTLFQMVTGQLPYDENDTEYDLYNLIVNEPFPNPKEFYVGVSEEMHKIIQKATSKRPLDRYQSCEEFSKALLGISKNTKIQIPLSMKTKIFDIANENENKPPVLNRIFWRNLILLVLTTLFVAAIGVGFYFLIKSDNRHVIANEQILFKKENENSKIIEKLKFGETVKVISLNSEKLKETSKWLKVVSLRGNSGFVETENIEKPKIYEQINIIFDNNDAQKLTPVFYKKQLRKYFVNNKLYNRVNIEWKLSALDKKEFEFNFIAKADFNNNEVEDFVCVLKNNLNKEKKLLFFLDNSNKPIAFSFYENIKIKTLKKGTKGGAWYLGHELTKQTKTFSFIKTNKYEYLPHDGLLLYKEKTGQTVVFLLNLEENLVTYFEQPTF
ncbi:MAG: serine/threonine protein kinase [Bacteroidales bacterium]|nr:serine/threonine protein kinase [Bacteroidales bacterium]MBN2756703.1 serine/threonine protein kinase [Bacteroidales bacterium]